MSQSYRRSLMSPCRTELKWDCASTTLVQIILLSLTNHVFAGIVPVEECINAAGCLSRQFLPRGREFGCCAFQEDFDLRLSAGVVFKEECLAEGGKVPSLSVGQFYPQLKRSFRSKPLVIAFSKKHEFGDMKNHADERECLLTLRYSALCIFPIL